MQFLQSLYLFCTKIFVKYSSGSVLKRLTFIRSHKKNNKISLATVYRTVKLLEEAKIIIKHDFKHGDEKARYEPISNWEHNHLLDINSGAVIEFHNPGFENLSKKIAEKLGYKILGYKLELFGIKEACKKIKASK